MIKHIVLPGGAATGYIDYGIIEYLEKNNFYKMENIESIHATSVGSLLACTLCFKFEWSYYREFIIYGHHDKTFYIDPNNIVNILNAKSLMVENCFKTYLKPFFLASDLDIETTTLKKLFEITKIDFYIYATKVSTISTVAFNHKTDPDMLVIDAISASCAIPIIFKPIEYKNDVYVDGGILSNYPLKECLENENIDPKEVMGILHQYKETTEIKKDDILNFNIFDLVLHILWILIEKLVNLYFENNKNKETIMKKINLITEIPVKMNSTSTTASDLFNALNSKDIRKQLIEEGDEIAKEYILLQSRV